MRSRTLRFLAWLPVLALLAPARAASDPLPSWHDTAPKKAITDFVTRVTTEGTEDFVPPAERIAVFDNDGTLWPENPMPFQLAFTLDEIKRLLPQNLRWKDDPAVQAALAGDLPSLMGNHHQGLLHLYMLSASGLTTDEFVSNVQRWFAEATHPRFRQPYDRLAYQPMLEVLAYLRANGFKTFIVSGGGADFMRVVTERLYGIPPEQVIGSSTRPVYELRASGPVLVKTMDNLFIDDRDGKPVGIHQRIGRRPIACFGNSDGDKAMLEYTTINNPRPSLGLIVHHTDAEREYAYDAKPKSSGKLAEALAEAPKRGWVVADMKNDWATVFSE
jgi:phosphoglycolate phosphatase-like HAD superfamily hydrolase